MVRVLVTGGAGYIGSVLVRLLLDMGCDVVVLDRLFFGSSSLSGIEDRVKIVKDDIRWFDSSVLDDVDVVFDLAALSNDPSGELDPSATYEINYRGRVRVAALSRKRGVSRYVYASTCSVYGFQDGLITESSPVNPLTAYARANYMAEQEILGMSAKGFVCVALRQATVYGYSPRMRFDLAVNGMVRSLFLDGKIKVMRDGSQWRPFVHVRDTSRAFILAMEADASLVNGEVFNVGSDEQNVQIIELAKVVAEACGVELEVEWYGDPDNRSYRVSFDKIKRILNFRPEWDIKRGAVEVWRSLEGGLVDPNDPRTITVKWYRTLLDNPDMYRELLINGRIF